MSNTVLYCLTVRDAVMIYIRYLINLKLPVRTRFLLEGVSF